MSEDIARPALYRLYETENHKPAQYRRNGKLWETNAFKNWLRMKQLNTGLSISQIEKHIAKIIIDENKIITFEETDEICLYNNGVFLRGDVSKSRIKSKILEVVNKKFSDYDESLSKRGMIIQIIKDMTPFSIINFGLDDLIINLRNGVIMYKNDKLVFTSHRILERRKEYLYTFIQFPIYYKRGAKCPIINKTLLEIFDNNQLIDIMEFVAYVLFPTIEYDKAIILQGPRDTGQTTFLNMLKQFYGISNIKQTKLHRLGKQFQMANLRNMAGLICDDLSEKELGLETCSDIKKVITNPYLSSEIKNIQNDKLWKNRTKIISACNKLPLPKNQADNWWKRWIGIDCFNQFKGKYKNTRLKHLKWSQEEISGFLNECIRAWRRLKKRDGFRAKWYDMDYIKRWWLSNIKPVAQFLERYCIVGDIDHSIDYEEFINKFNNHRIKNRLLPYSKSLISRELIMVDDRIRKIKVHKSYNPDSSGHKYPYITWNGLLRAEESFEKLREHENSKHVEFEDIVIEEKAKIYDPALKRAV